MGSDNSQEIVGWLSQSFQLGKRKVVESLKELEHEFGIVTKAETPKGGRK